MGIAISTTNTPVSKQWSKYLGNSENKINLCSFLCEQWCVFREELLEVDQEMIIANGFANGTVAVRVTKKVTLILFS